MCCESSEGSYTVFNLINGNQVLVSRKLKEYDEMLSEYGFFRVHKSWLINLIHITSFDRMDGGYIVLNNENKVPVASRKREQLMELFDRMGGG